MERWRLTAYSCSGKYEASVRMSAAHMPRTLIDSGRDFWTHTQAIERATFVFLALFADCSSLLH